MSAAPPADSAAGTEFFEKKIRPLLIESCYECHSYQASKGKGGLYLDTKDALLKGGDTGPGIVPGDVEKSLLIKAVRYADKDLRMPPKDKKLSAEKIADLESWVKMGAPDPRVSDAQIAKLKFQSSSKHWAFKPIVQPPLPAVRNTRWVESPVDAFVLAKLEARGWTPSIQADKRTLIRRVTYDLTGLPPTAEEVAAFEADRAPDAYAKLVDRLLASPRYGERWGRYWLDVARYADTKGYVGGNEEVRYPFAYTYRDYVIRAFNEDLPYDRFILQQIAADQLKLGGDNRPLAALGFLTVGRRFINNEHDIIDDRLDVICRGTMALTISCARCHDHKFDPIPTQDYYSLYGVFKSSNEPKDKPLLQHQPVHPEYTNFVNELARRQNELKTYTASNEVFVLNKLRHEVGDYLLALNDTKDFNDAKRDEEVRGKRKLNMAVYNRWQKHLAEKVKAGDPVFQPWRELAALTNDFPAKAKGLCAAFTANAGTNKLNPFVAKMFAGMQPTNIQPVAQAYGKLFTDVEEHWQNELKLADPVTVLAQGQTNPPPLAALADANEEALRQVLYAEGAPPNPPRDQFGNLFLFDDGIKNKIGELEKNVASLEVTHPGAPPRAMILGDNSKPVDVKVFVRGDPGRQGDLAPRRFLEIASKPGRALFPTNSSGRLELARAIVSRDNPLTARVFVNRVWLNHFGVPLVRTPSDFGLRAEPPTHPELLDYLAARFMDDGWSVKKLHRLILLSNAYRQNSADNPAYARVDPANTLLWRMNRRRLDFEALRDSLLAVSGKLDFAAGGQPVDIVANMAAARRTIYGFVDRQDLPNLFRIFDFANPDSSSPQRFETIVAPQALYLLNSPFMIDRVKSVSQRARQTAGSLAEDTRASDERRVRAFYRVIYQRDPTPHEYELGRHFFINHPAGDVLIPEITAWQYGYGAYDAQNEHVTNFTSFVKFTGTAWQPGDKMPDAKLGYLFLDSEGGHPGGSNQLATIRRWVAPHEGHVSIRGEFSHGSTNGDGVRATVVSSRFGKLGQWTAFNNKVQAVLNSIEVKKGESLDFVTECMRDNSSDSFKWAPIIEMTDAEPMVMTGQPTVWDAKVNFADPKKLPKTLNAWEEYAQVLLLANEFAFVD